MKFANLSRALTVQISLIALAGSALAQNYDGLCQTNANQVEFVIPGFRWTAQNTCDFQQPLVD
jgi:hypothetical protein